jgi:hypothetical protein
MPNRYWYYALVVVGIGAAVITMYRKRKEIPIAAMITFYLAAMSITMLLEVFVLVIWEAYVYKPQVFSDAYKDSICGHLLANSTLYPGTALLVGAFALRYRWILLISLFYTLVEVLFLRLDLYEHRWWQLYMTAGGAFLFHCAAKIWYRKLRVPAYNLPWYITFYFAGRRVLGIPLNILDFGGMLKFNVAWMDSLQRGHSVFTAVYQFGMAVFLLLFVSVLKKWYYKLVPLVLFPAANFILIRMGILDLKDGMNLLYFTLVQAGCLGMYILLDKYTLRNKNTKPGALLNDS